MYSQYRGPVVWLSRSAPCRCVLYLRLYPICNYCDLRHIWIQFKVTEFITLWQQREGQRSQTIIFIYYLCTRSKRSHPASQRAVSEPTSSRITDNPASRSSVTFTSRSVMTGAPSPLINSGGLSLRLMTFTCSVVVALLRK